MPSWTTPSSMILHKVFSPHCPRKLSQQADESPAFGSGSIVTNVGKPRCIKVIDIIPLDLIELIKIRQFLIH